MVVGESAPFEGQYAGDGGSRAGGWLLEELAFRRCERHLCTSKLPPARPFSTLDAAKEDGAWFAGHAKVMTSRQVTIQPIPHDRSRKPPGWVNRHNARKVPSSSCKCPGMHFNVLANKTVSLLIGGPQTLARGTRLILTKMRRGITRSVGSRDGKIPTLWPEK